MFSVNCNIDKTDRINRTVIGSILLYWRIDWNGKILFYVVGLILIVEGIIGWCSIPHLMNKIKRH